MDVKPGAQWAVEFPDTVGTGYYGMDIHPSKNEPGTWADTLPYHLPLGAFIGKGGPPNVIPAAKNIGGSRLALASVRMHPTEWLCGEVAGHLAAFCIKNQVDPAAVRAKKTLLTAFQTLLYRYTGQEDILGTFSNSDPHSIPHSRSICGRVTGAHAVRVAYSGGPGRASRSGVAGRSWPAGSCSGEGVTRARVAAVICAAAAVVSGSAGAQ